MAGISLNKYISSSGFCSRREADKLIEQARVTINGELVVDNARVMPGDKVEVDGERMKPTAKERAIYIAFNKPVGVTSTTDPKDKTNIISFIGHPNRIFPIGRLDKDSDGLIFLTNDGDIVNKILRASNFHEKEYIVTVDKAITPDFIAQMSAGVPVQGEVTRKCFVRQEGGRRFRIILTQGLNRQIRRMCEYLGYDVKELRRIRIMNIKLDSLPLGKWRYFTAPEIDKLNEMVSESSMTEKAEARIKGWEDPKEKAKERAAVQYIPKRKPAMEEEDFFFDEPKSKGKPKSAGKYGVKSAAKPARGAKAAGRSKDDARTPRGVKGSARPKEDTRPARGAKAGSKPKEDTRPARGAKAKAGGKPKEEKWVPKPPKAAKQKEDARPGKQAGKASVKKPAAKGSYAAFRGNKKK